VAAFNERGVISARGCKIYESSFICPLCGSGCELKAEYLEDGQLRRIVPESGRGPTLAASCARGRFGLKGIGDLVTDELLPVIKLDNRPRAVSWEEALAAAVKLLKIYQPEEIALVSAGPVQADGLLAFYQFGHLLGTRQPFISFIRKIFWRGQLLSKISRELTFDTELTLRNSIDTGLFFLVDTDLNSEALAFWLEIKKGLRRGARLLVLDAGLNRSGQTAEVYLRCSPGKETEALLALLKKVSLKSAELSFYPGYYRLLDELSLWSEEYLSRTSGLRAGELERAARILLSSSPALFLFGQRFLRQPRWLETWLPSGISV